MSSRLFFLDTQDEGDSRRIVYDPEGDERRRIGDLDVDALFAEAVPLLKLVGVIWGFIFAQRWVLRSLAGLLGGFGFFLPYQFGLLSFLTQVLLVVGAALVLLYVLVRAKQLTAE